MCKDLNLLNLYLGKVTYRGDNSLVIRKGLTSRGTTIGEFKIEDEVEFSEGFEDQSGFYLRLRGHFDQHDDLVIIYNSFKKDRMYESMFYSIILCHVHMQCDT